MPANTDLYISILRASKAYQFYVLDGDNRDASLSDPMAHLGQVYYNWFRYHNGASLLASMHPQELCVLDEFVDTPGGFRIRFMTKIMLEGAYGRSLQKMSEEEFLGALGNYLRFIGPEADILLDHREIDELTKLNISYSGWVLPNFLIALGHSDPGLSAYITSNSFGRLVGWFVDQVARATKYGMLVQLYESIAWDILSYQGFETGTDNATIAIQRYVNEYVGHHPLGDLEQIFDYLDWAPALQRKTKGLSLPNGVTLIGAANRQSGIGEDVRQVVKALSHAEIDNSVFLYPTSELGDCSNSEVDSKIKRHLVYDTLIFNLTAEETFRFFVDHGAALRDSRYVIGYWPWELSKFPEALAPALDFVDEIWAPSKYIADAIGLVTQKPVVVMGLPVDYSGLESLPEVKGRYFASSRNVFKVLVAFDGLSYPERKNPTYAINAFLAAFSDRQDAELVIKTMNLAACSEYQQLAKQLEAYANISIVDDSVDRSTILALIREADCLLSLHRAEGFGRVVAEAMLLGTPVITSAYSGNLDFCFPENSYLIRGRTVSVAEGAYPYWHGQQWFEPDVESAAMALLELYRLHTSGEPNRKAAAARNTISDSYSAKKMGAKYAARLRQIWGEKAFRNGTSFDPVFYRIYNQDTRQMAPMEHYTMYGHRENRATSQSRLRARQLAPAPVEMGLKAHRVLVSVHSYYMDDNYLLAEYLANLEEFDYDVRVNVPSSVASTEHMEVLRSVYGQRLVHIGISENRGRDVGGMLENIRASPHDVYDVVFVLHTKRSPQNAESYAEFWQKSLLDSILGSRARCADIVFRLRSNRSAVGIVGAATWRSTTVDSNEVGLTSVMDRLNVGRGHRIVEYLSGSIYAARFSVLRRVADEFSLSDFKCAEGQPKEFFVDGQLEHAIERAFGALVSEAHMHVYWT